MHLFELFTFRLAVWYGVAHNRGAVERRQYAALTDNMHPGAPPARWHLWASVAMPTSHHTADCKCYQSCQVEAIFVLCISTQWLTNTLNATNQAANCLDQRSDKPWLASERPPVQGFCVLDTLASTEPAPCSSASTVFLHGITPWCLVCRCLISADPFVPHVWQGWKPLAALGSKDGIPAALCNPLSEVQ